MANFVIWHNPRCSKSQQTLDILEGEGVDPEVRFYLEDKVTHEELGQALKLLGLRPIELCRTQEEIFKTLQLSKEDPDHKILDAMIAYPKLIERPIVIKNSMAAELGRPPENVRELF